MGTDPIVGVNNWSLRKEMTTPTGGHQELTPECRRTCLLYEQAFWMRMVITDFTRFDDRYQR
jgi:hypothetical protein